MSKRRKESRKTTDCYTLPASLVSKTHLHFLLLRTVFLLQLENQNPQKLRRLQKTVVHSFIASPTLSTSPNVPVSKYIRSVVPGDFLDTSGLGGGVGARGSQ